MLFYIIPSLMIITSLSIIIFVIVKKLPDLATINIESINQEREAKVRNRIIKERLARKFADFKKIISPVINSIVNKLTSTVNNLYQKTITLEKENLKSSQPLKKIDLHQKIKEKLEEVKKLLVNQDFAKAEEVCISIIELDPKNLDVYELLSEIYLENKEYKKARETGRYLLKLLTRGKEISDKHRLANCYADLGWIYQLESKNSYALANFSKAVELEPVNPRFLDLLLKICIILKNKNLAQQTFTALKKADPDNQKLAELKEETDAINS